MSLATYEEARPWAKAMKEEVLARRMPKWHVVRGYGDFSNDPSLSAFEVALIASWVDGGAPRLIPGQAPKTLPGSKPAEPRDASPAVPAVKTRTVSTPCSTRLLPAGRLLALKPLLDKGSSLRLDLARGDGSDQPLIWVRDFDPAFAETYWLRTPANVSRGTRLVADSTACTVVLTYAE